MNEKRENDQSVYFIPINSFIIEPRLTDAVKLLQRAKIDVWSWSFEGLRKNQNTRAELVWTSLVSKISQSSRRLFSCPARLLALRLYFAMLDASNNTKATKFFTKGSSTQQIVPLKDETKKI